MSFYVLQYTNKSVVAMSKDKWLLQLFIVQRKLNKDECRIKKKKKSNKCSYNYLKYYYGIAITNREYEYITRLGLEAQSDIDMEINNLLDLLIIYKNSISKKEKKNIKKTIKTLEKIDVLKDKEIIKTRIDEILNKNSVVDEYFYNLEMFRNYIEQY